MAQFFAANGSHILMFYYECGKVDEGKGTATSAKPKPKVYVTDGRKEAFTGLCVFFIRTTPKAITPANVNQEVCVNVC